MVDGQTRHVIGYMKDFLFGPEQASTPVGVLSGGERGRLMLARAFARPSNLLVLDEPTNDLDLETLDLLQEMLADYPGTVLLVSHDRDFLDRVVTSVIVAEGDGRWTEYAGGYTDMVAQRPAPPNNAGMRAHPGAKIARIRAQPPSNIAQIRPSRMLLLPRTGLVPAVSPSRTGTRSTPCPRASRSCNPRSRACTPLSPTPTSTPATPAASGRTARPSPRRSRRWRRPRSNGSPWRCCGKRSRADRCGTGQALPARHFGG